LGNAASGLAMIDARITKHFPTRKKSAPFILDVHFKALANITAFFGPSGAGKTLILDCIAGFTTPDAGRILLDDQIAFDAEARVNVRPQDRRCGYVFQNYALFPHMSLRDNLLFAAGRVNRRERHRRANEMLERFRLSEVAGRRPHEVSGGQKQRCSIARCLIGSPRVLLLDEPSRGLDAPLRSELYAIVRELRKEFGIPVLLVTHSLRECFELADEMIILRDGAIEQSGSPAAVCDEPRNIELAKLLGIYNILPVEIRTLDPSRNSSVLRFGSWDIQGEYLPGHLKGDRVHLLVAPQQLRVRPKWGEPKHNEIPGMLVRGIETPYFVRMEFEGGLHVEVPPGEFDVDPHNKEYWVEFPVRGLRVL
jgi:molybdate transport system ATP-binding protein